MKRAAVAALAALAVFVVVVPTQVDGECCGARGGTCGDCSRGTPNCGYGPCNIFGCDCPPVPPNGWVCRVGQCFKPGKRSVDDVSIANGEDVVSIADVDRDGVLSMAEAASFLQQHHNVTRSKRSLYEGLALLDKNNDGVLSALEIDPEN